MQDYQPKALILTGLPSRDTFTHGIVQLLARAYKQNITSRCTQGPAQAKAHGNLGIHEHKRGSASQQHLVREKKKLTENRSRPSPGVNLELNPLIVSLQLPASPSPLSARSPRAPDPAPWAVCTRHPFSGKPKHQKGKPALQLLVPTSNGS